MTIRRRLREHSLGRLADVRLRTKLALAISVVLAIIAGFVYLYFPHVQKAQAVRALTNRGKSIASMSAYGVGAGLYFEDTVATKAGYQGALHNADLRYLVVYDSLQRPFASYNPLGLALRSHTSGMIDESVLLTDEMVHLSVPIMTQGHLIGQLQIGMSMEEIQMEEAVAKSSTALVSAFILLAGAFVSWLLGSVATRPLSEVVQTAEQIAGGDLTKRVKRETNDEVGHLAKSFNKMIGTLEVAHESLKKANVSLEEQKLSLSAEVLERTKVEAELRVFTSRLEQSNRELQEFASIASHDLQEPLRKVRAFGDRLAAKSGAVLDDQSRDYLQRMQNAASRMQVLINDLLTYSRVTTKAQPFVTVDLNQITREVLSDLEVRVEEVSGRIELGTLPAVKAEPLQMRQLMQNIIGNALKYRRPEIPPVVRIFSKHGDGEWRIVVEDNGIGFEQQYASKIFGIFQRLHGREEYEGTGVGLAVCQKIVSRHGGQIDAEGFPGSGARFTIRLPINTEEDTTDGERVETDHVVAC